MIRIFLGNVGSGKTACAVREMVMCISPHVTYSNIMTKGIRSNIIMNNSMLVKKTQVGMQKNGNPIIKYEFNKEYWQNAVETHKYINVVLDEAHTILNARRAMSKQTTCMLDFIALIRRVVGQDPSGQGTLTLISQLERRIDVIAAEMCNQVRYHICHYLKTCAKCGYTFQENNECAELCIICPSCGHYYLKKHSLKIEVMHFPTMQAFTSWKYAGFDMRNICSAHYMINDIERYFRFYNTLQWDNLLSDV